MSKNKPVPPSKNNPQKNKRVNPAKEKLQEFKDFVVIKKNPKLRAFFWILFSLITFLLFYIFRFYLWPAIFAMLFFIVLNPLYLYLRTFLRGRESWSSFLIILSSFFLIFLPAALILIAVSREAVKASALLNETVKIETVRNYLATDKRLWKLITDFGIKPGQIIAKIMNFTQDAINFLVNNLTNFIAGSFGIVFDIIIMSIILFFLLKESKKISEIFYDLLPFPYEMEHRIVKRIERVIRDVFYGNLIIMFLQGILLFILLLIFQVPSAILWGVIGGIFSIIPVVSTAVVWLPVAIYFVFAGNYTDALLFSALALAVAQILENLVKPKFLDKKLNIHPLILFFSLLGGLKAFGIAGLILGPAVVTLFVSFMEGYRIIEEFTPNSEKKKSIFFQSIDRIGKNNKRGR
jgi:predicted PurR-regulated permease PerM